MMKRKMYSSMDQTAEEYGDEGETSARGQRRRKGGRQETIGDSKEELRNNACRELARWFYDAGISFNSTIYDSFLVAMEAVARFGPGFKPPSAHELSGLLLKKEVEDIENYLKGSKKKWARDGCSILFDGWHDSTIQKSIVNLLVDSPKGSKIFRSLDVPKIKKDEIALYRMLDDMVDEVGEENVVQVVTNTASNYVMAGRMLEATREKLYWTPCATHCIDLMLEDIGSIPKVRSSLKLVMFMNGYIYNNVGLVNMMSRFTNQRNLHMPAITRFATSFLTLSQIHKQKNNLQKMITSEDWKHSKWSKEAMGKKVASIIFEERFWTNIVYALKLTEPLVEVLRMVNG